MNNNYRSFKRIEVSPTLTLIKLDRRDFVCKMYGYSYRSKVKYSFVNAGCEPGTLQFAKWADETFSSDHGAVDYRNTTYFKYSFDRIYFSESAVTQILLRWSSYEATK